MLIESRTRELYELLAALVERPEPGALIIGCIDPETLYLLHGLLRLDTECPADRFYIAEQPFFDPATYVHTITEEICAFTGRPLSPLNVEPAAHLRAVIAELLAGLPEGDHRLVVALIPSHIDDTASFAALLDALRVDPLPSRLRLIFREDLEELHVLQTAEQSSSDQLLAYRFHLPASLVVESVRATAQDPARPSDERAQAVMELAVHDYGHGLYTDVITACNAVIDSDVPTPLVALALVVRADSMRALGQLDDALASASHALHHAVECEIAPLIHHAAMTLGGICSDLDNIEDATRCFRVAELAVPDNEEAQALARERRLALNPDPPC